MAETTAKILVVEDENIVAMDIRNMLKRLGHEVIAVVSTGESAIQKAEELHPQLILMDIFLKGEMDGIQAASQIRIRFDTPIIFLTAHSDVNTKQRAFAVSPHGYMLKPFSEKELDGIIKKALEKIELCNH